MDDLKKRVEQFQALQLPGQLQMMHMGTLYLVNDLWKEVQRLHAQPTVQADANFCAYCYCNLKKSNVGCVETNCKERTA
jgi:hypothetical protein